jgi:uncharacterized damage-inducible protein DinB
MTDSKGCCAPSFIAQLVEENTGSIGRLIGLVCELSPDQYQQQFGRGCRHALGKQVRHIIDHYAAFLRELGERHVAGVDYEQRRRDVLLETNPHAACHCLREICVQLETLEHDSARRPLVLQHTSGNGCAQVPTSVGRELAFLSSHTIHHMAIIALLAEQLGVDVSHEFGVHPSTTRHAKRVQSMAVAL